MAPEPYNFAEKYLEVMRDLGTPEQVRKRMAALDEMLVDWNSRREERTKRDAALDLLLEEHRRRAWLLGMIKTIALWATAVAVGWGVFKGVLTNFRDWLLGLS